MSYRITKNKYMTAAEVLLLKPKLDRSNIAVIAIETLLATGARPQEVLNIRPCDLDATDCTVYIRGLKNSDDREIPLDAGLMAALLALCKEGQPVFPFKVRWFRELWYQYRPAPKQMRCCRHTFAVLLYDKTKDILLTQSALGHKSINNTLVYAKHLETKDKLRKALL